MDNPALFDQPQGPFLQNLLVSSTWQQEHLRGAITVRIFQSAVRISVEGGLHLLQIRERGASIPFTPARKYVEQPLCFCRRTDDYGTANGTAAPDPAHQQAAVEKLTSHYHTACKAEEAQIELTANRLQLQKKDGDAGRTEPQEQRPSQSPIRLTCTLHSILSVNVRICTHYRP